MKDTTLFSLILRLPGQWELVEVVPNLADQTLVLRVKEPRAGPLSCPVCALPLDVQGHREAERPCPWGVMRFKTKLVFETVRRACKVHGPMDATELPILTEDVS